MTDHKVYIANAFSIQMIQDLVEKEGGVAPHIWPMSIGSVREFWRDKVEVISAIGHEDTAHVVSDIIGQHIDAQRINIKLNKRDILIVAQLIGGRLPEGALHLPDDFRIKFFGVQVK